MTKALLLYRGGVCSEKKKLADGEEHTLYFKAKSPMDISLFSAAETRFSNEGDAQVREREKRRADFIASSMCDESGQPLMSAEEALNIPASLKPELCSMIIRGSSETGDAKKG